MAESKSAARMDYWRNYFLTSNADIFETIEKAIIVAASDYPKEFRIRRDGIAQTLFSCKLIKCSGCDKVKLALPGNDEQQDDYNDDDEGVKCKSESLNVDGNGSKGSNKEISGWRDDEDDDHHHKDLKVNNHQLSNYSYGVAEALTDEIEEETQMFGEVVRIKEIVDNSQDESESVLYNSLRKLELMALSVETLKATAIGKSVNTLRKHASKDVSQTTRTLIEAWKDMVDQWVIATEKTAVSEATPESLNPSVLDEEEEGLPSPPLDDLAFFYPHATSLELSEFFDGMDESGNPGNSGGFNKNHDDGRMVKQSVPKWKQQKPSNEPTMVPKKESGCDVKKQEDSTKMKKKHSTIAKPIKTSVAESGPGRQVKLNNTERKLQTVPKRPHQSKLRTSGEDKFEATKRKLQERYQQAENVKKQRTIQVMELHDLPKKQGVPVRNQHIRPGTGNNHNRHR